MSYNLSMVQIIAPAMIPTGRKMSVSQALQQAVQKIVSSLHPSKIILFGSYAYGSPTPDSDVDLLVVMETDLPFKERSWQVSRLLIPRPFPVDILVKTPQEISRALSAGNFFIQEIISQGIVLYERNQLMLSTLCDEAGIFLPIEAKDLNRLNDYSVQIRYPGENPTVEDAQDALRISRNVRLFVRKLLGLK